VAFVVGRSMKRNVLDFKAVDEQICVLRIKTRLQNTLQLLMIRGWGRKAANRDEWRRLMRKAKARKGL
jgi:hypothetical protein